MDAKELIVKKARAFDILKDALQIELIKREFRYNDVVFIGVAYAVRCKDEYGRPFVSQLFEEKEMKIIYEVLKDEFKKANKKSSWD